MGVIWHKVWYDLWHNKLRTLLVTISIAVGVFAVGTTFGMVEQMLPTMDAAHKSTMPSHGTIYLTQPIDLDTILALRKVPGVEAIEATNTIEIRYKIRPQDEWRKGHILQRADYEHQTYDIVQLKKGVWPDGPDLSIERMHGAFYGIDIGDDVIIEVGDRERVLPITGKIRHPFVPPPSMYALTWFFGNEEAAELFGVPKGQFTELKFRASSYSLENAHRVAAEIKERLAKQGVRDAGVVYQDPDQHWGRVFLDGMSLVLKVLAVLSMLLSIVLVMNTLTAIITQQTNQIGILKAIGGNSFTITKVYLAAVLIYGILALGVAFPLGSMASFRTSQWMLGLYNIEYDNNTFSVTILLIEIFAAVIVPLLAALFPILNGASITVRQAIASYGLGGNFGSSWIDREVERFGRKFLISYQAIALANTFRRKGRLLLTQLVLVTAGVMFLMVLGLSSSITATLDREFERRDHDVILTFDNLQRVDFTCDLANQVQGVQKADMWLVVPATILRQGHKRMDAGLGSALYGVQVEEAMYTPLIVDGRWLQPGDDRVVVLNKDTADDENLHVGDRIALDLGQWGEEQWQIVGLYRVFLMFGGGFNLDAIYSPRAAVFDATKKTGKATTLLIRTYSHQPDDVAKVASLLEDHFHENHVEISSTETMSQLRKTSDSSFSIVIMMMLVLAVIVALVGGIGLMGSLWISVIERTKEVGMMRAIGATSSHIMSMFVLEAVIQGLMSWVIATPIALIVTPIMANALGQTMFKSQLEYQFNLAALFIWLAIILGISVLASIIPARSAANINVRQSLSYE